MFEEQGEGPVTSGAAACDVTGTVGSIVNYNFALSAETIKENHMKEGDFLPTLSEGIRLDLFVPGETERRSMHGGSCSHGALIEDLHEIVGSIEQYEIQQALNLEITKDARGGYTWVLYYGPKPPLDAASLTANIRLDPAQLNVIQELVGKLSRLARAY